MTDNYNIEIVGIQQETARVYEITISTYTNIGYQLDTDYGGYKSLGTVTYKGQKYQGIELTVVPDSNAEVPKTQNSTFIIPQNDASTIGIYVKCGTQIAVINFH
ncbi:hypothetical protein [Polaribacter sp. Hel1_85]|uniref:hypothetical protein n=1 Tax=Polaribacter sp. Hel1_85 TaxID=1250005 RepID=UPI00052BC234|nr:hypothetical protein [Polaribacter sp. Hel1_85]KGL63805.1 hypothetical protein PHEL85_0846 [Polaribacter sp. Hel1_85]